MLEPVGTILSDPPGVCAFAFETAEGPGLSNPRLPDCLKKHRTPKCHHLFKPSSKTQTKLLYLHSNCPQTADWYAVDQGWTAVGPSLGGKEQLAIFPHSSRASVLTRQQSWKGSHPSLEWKPLQACIFQKTCLFRQAR